MTVTLTSAQVMIKHLVGVVTFEEHRRAGRVSAHPAQAGDGGGIVGGQACEEPARRRRHRRVIAHQSVSRVGGRAGAAFERRGQHERSGDQRCHPRPPPSIDDQD